MDSSSSNNINKIKCVNARFAMPLFMVSRNRLKYSKLNELRHHINKMNNEIDKNINKENDLWQCPPQQAATQKCMPSKKVQQIGKHKPQLSKNSWKLPPNLYNSTKIPFKHKKGAGGAHWKKMHTHKAKILTDQHRHATTALNNLPKINEKLFATCHRAKGIFLTNARERRATIRSMINNMATCYKNPTEPGPATYNPNHTKIISAKKANLPIPHLFYSSSIVPVKQNSIHQSHTSFTAAPGRYETRYSNTCPCASKLVYQPTIDLIIDEEKRKKFRRLPYQKLKAADYTAPDWRHVKGEGYRRLFIEPPQTSKYKQKPLILQEHKKQKPLQLYPNAKYIGMINNPVRTPLSCRTSPVRNLMPRINFNCTAKRITRKQLRINKKIVFNSTQERFKDSYRVPVLTLKQQEQLKQTLPLERQFRDHPIMHQSLSEIKTKLDQTPKHMLPNYVPKLRKKIFKFQPLPQPKVLVTEEDTKVKEVSKRGYYFSTLDATNFFKD